MLYGMKSRPLREVSLSGSWCGNVGSNTILLLDNMCIPKSSLQHFQGQVPPLPMPAGAHV